MMRRKKKIADSILIAIAVFAGLVFLFPIFWMVRSSFMGLEELYQTPPVILPRMGTMKNYKEALQQSDLLLQFRNSCMITALCVAGTVLSSSITAYGFSRFDFQYKNIWFMLIISTMMLPAAVTLIPQYQMWNKLHLLGTIAPMVVPAWFGGSAYFTFMLRQFFQTIPKELDEAARVDGAGYFRIYCEIILPLTKPALIVVALFAFVNAWNEFFYTVIYLNGHQELKTLTLGLYMFKGVYSTNYGAVLALAGIISIPALLFFLIGNRYFVEGISMTGIKG
ncbi:MAG: carbohydrate ABC transporter permease [Lachnospiraceae bacterium]|jgi:multiple sugar transport system permease protein|nr:carbohydrate ABC transporter permease [Lachnospiraceae bacterium]